MVSNQLNRLYLKFLKRNPGYNGKVSLYGHSLGSVLSYDILCHQENMFSPFPMDFMYNEHPGNEESLDDQFSVGDPLKNIEDNTFHVVNIAKGKVHSTDEELSSTQSTIQHEDGVAEDFSTIMSPPASGPVTSKAENNLVHDSIDLSPQRSDYLSEAIRMEHNESTIGLEGMASQDCKENSNQEKVVYLLQEEIDSLKAKIVNWNASVLMEMQLAIRKLVKPYLSYLSRRRQPCWMMLPNVIPLILSIQSLSSRERERILGRGKY